MAPQTSRPQTTRTDAAKGTCFQRLGVELIASSSGRRPCSLQPGVWCRQISRGETAVHTTQRLHDDDRTPAARSSDADGSIEKRQMARGQRKSWLSVLAREATRRSLRQRRRLSSTAEVLV